MELATDLIKKYGVRGALSYLGSKLPSYHIPKFLREKKEYIETHQTINLVKSLCVHKDKRTECIDYHKRDFGTICNDCGKILNTNG